MESNSSSTNEDGEIIQLSRGLSTSLSVGFQPSGVSWMGNLGHPLNLPSDQTLLLTKGPRSGFLVLPLALRGKLDLDDWKSLLTSAMLLQLRPEFKRRLMSRYALMNVAKIAVMIIAFFPLILIISGVGYFISGLSDILLLLVSWMFLWLVAFLILPRGYNRYVVRNTRLRADQRAAEILGRDQLIRTLEKIDGFKILDLEERKQKTETMWQRRVSPWPTLTERLTRLRAFSAKQTAPQ